MIPFVTVITPTANRANNINRIIAIFNNQDYLNKELLIIYDKPSDIPQNYPLNGVKFLPVHNLSLGAKRNYGCYQASGDIIVHMDDDDWYAKDWISQSVKVLGENEITGLSKAYFARIPHNMWLYQHKMRQPYVCEATMCYTKARWERQPFKEVSEGEGAAFCAFGKIVPHDYTDGFCAMIHGQNTSSHKALSSMTRINPNLAEHLLQEDYELFK